MKNLQIFSMCLFVIIIANMTFSQKVYADCYSKFLRNPAGGDKPPTSPTVKSNCSGGISSKSDESVIAGTCDSGGYLTTYFCANGQSMTAIASGEIIIYGQASQYSVTKGSQTYTASGSDSEGKSTGIMIEEGETYSVNMNGSNGTGWRAYNPAVNSLEHIDTAIVNATNKDYTIMSVQTWADALSGSLFDSYDFNDQGLLIAVKGEQTPKCNNSDINLVANPTAITLGVTGNITLSRNATVAIPYYKMSANEQTPGNAFTCNWSALDGTAQSKSVNCTVNATYPNPSVTWTHRWCNTMNGSCEGKQICSKSITINTPVQECSDTDINLSSNPASIVLGVNSSVTLSRTATKSIPNYFMGVNSQTPSNAFNCNWNSFSGTGATKSVTCLVDQNYTSPTVTWTHRWCNTNSGSCASKKICSRSLTLGVAYKACENSDITLSSNPSNLTSMMLGVDKTITLTQTAVDVLPKYVFVSNDQSPVTAFENCNWSSPTISGLKKSVDCNVVRKPDFPNTEVVWSHRWCNSMNGSCSGQTICTANLELNIDPYGAYMRTELGNSFIKGNMDQERFPVSPLSDQKFSTYNYSTHGTNIPARQSWLSYRNYLLLEYADSNGRDNFYNYIKSRLGVVAKLSIKSAGFTLTDGNYDSSVGGSDAVVVNGSLTLSSVNCKSKTIFFVSGNLIVNSNFLINGYDNACLFIVDGSTIVNDGVTDMKAFVITRNFTSSEDNHQLILKGGLIVQTSNSFLRNVNLRTTEATEIVMTTPSEILSYEGARYLKAFGHLLNEPTKFSIREIQYTQGSNN